MTGTTRGSRASGASIEQWMSGKVVARIGLGLLLIGLVFLFRWSIIQGWIGPLARVLIGAAISTALLASGFVIRRRRPGFAVILQGGGLAGLYLSAFAAHRLYELVDGGPALVQLSVISAAAIAVSLRQGDQSLAVIGIIGGLAAPLLMGGVPAFPGDFGFVAMVAAVAAAVYYRTGWTAVHGTAAVGVGLLIGIRILALHFFDGPAVARNDAQLGLVVAVLALYAVPVVRAVAQRLDDELAPLWATATIPFLGYLGSLVLWTTPDDPPTTTYLWAAIGLAAAAGVLAISGHLSRIEVHGLAIAQYIPAAGLVGVAAVITLDGPALFVATAAEAAGIVLAGRRAQRAWLEWAGHGLLGVTVVASASRAFVMGPTSPVFVSGDAIAHLAVIATLVALAWMYHRDAGRPEIVVVYAVLAHVGMIGWMANELREVEGGSAMFTAALGGYGLGLLVTGVLTQLGQLRLHGLLTIGFAVSKLLLIDIATVSPGWRIVLFMSFGITLLGIGYWLARGTEEPDGSHASARTQAGAAPNQVSENRSSTS